MDLSDMTGARSGQMAGERPSPTQKLAAIKTLAHDFNNLLTVIRSYSELVLDDLSEEHQRKYLEQVLQAARRGSELTGQLLALSSGQELTPTLDTPQSS